MTLTALLVAAFFFFSSRSWDSPPHGPRDDLGIATIRRTRKYMETATTIDTTPATTTESAPAAPATSAPDSAVSTSERPQTARDLSAWMAKHDGADATPSPDAAASTDPAATVPATAPKDGTTNPTPDKGPIPFEVHSKALDNARVKERSAVMAEVQTQLSQVVGIPPAELSQLVEFSRTVHTDPQGHTFGMLKGLLADPVHGPKTRSELARMFGGLRAPAPIAPPDFTPDVQITDDTGRVVGTTFSAEKVKALLEHSVQERIAPLQQESAQRKADRDQQIAQQRQAETAKQVEAKADEVMSDVMDLLDGDKAHLTAVNKAMTENPTWSAHKAAMHVRKTVIVPSLQGKTTAAVVDSFNKKAAGNTANGAGSSATPAKPRDAKSLARWMEANSR